LQLDNVIFEEEEEEEKEEAEEEENVCNAHLLLA
jgi:hypothetical protein